MVLIENKYLETEKIEKPKYDSSKFEREHMTLKELIKHIVKYDKLARKDYFHLCLRVWISSNQIQLIVPMSSYNKIYKPDSITRIFRELMTQAKKGNEELQFLLKDTETIDKRDNLENLNHNYYQEQNLSNRAMILK